VLEVGVENAVEQRVPALRVRQRAGPLDRRFDRRDERLHQRDEDAVLRGEVVQDRGLRDAQPIGEGAQRGAVVAVPDEHLDRLGQDPLPGAVRFLPGRDVGHLKTVAVALTVGQRVASNGLTDGQ
jgi:hypothetical protein